MGYLRPTLKELSAELGLSPSTVSLVLSGRGEDLRIADATRSRIEELARKKGYRPNPIARSMRTGRTGTVAVLFPHMDESYMIRMLAGIESVLHQEGLSLMIATCELNKSIESRNLANWRDRRADGALLVPVASFRGREEEQNSVEDFLDAGIPTVFLDRYPIGRPCHAVVGDDRNDAFAATQMLLKHGCRKPAYLGFDLAITTLDDRLRGFREACLASKEALEPTEVLLHHQNPASTDIVSWLNGEGRKADGFLVSTSGLALKLRSLLLDKFGETGNLPPIVRFGEDSPYFPSGMMSIPQPHEKIGRRGAQRLLELIQRKGGPPSIDIVTKERPQ